MSSHTRAVSSDRSSPYAKSDDVFHNGEFWASAPSEDPWDPCILTLDGGGIRGYSSLLIIQALMHEIAIWERRLADENSATGTNSQVVEKLRPLASRDVKDIRGAVPNGSANLYPERTVNIIIDDERRRDSAQSSESRENRPEGISVDGLGEIDEHTLLPCHYFDYMYGTSTGGLIATMLGRLRMTVPQCLEIYKEVGQELFGRRRSFIPLMTKYHHRPLERAVRDILRSHCKQHTGEGECSGNDWHPWDLAVNNVAGVDFNRNICQSICLTAINDGRIDEAHLLRTYDHQYVDIPDWITPYNIGADKLRIWEVTRATSAAPFYFDSLEADVNGERWTFKDGGIRENNPAGAAWSEFISMYGENKDPALLLSIGTGRPDESKDGFAAAWPAPFRSSKLVMKAAGKFAVFKNVLIKYTDGELKHKDMINTARGEYKWYKRLNVSKGLESLPLDEWKKGEWRNPATGETSVVSGGATLTRMEHATEAYLHRDYDKEFDTYAPPKTMLSQIAAKLVRQRRARQATREQNPERWDTFMGKYITGQYVGQPDGPLVHPITKAETSSVPSAL